MSVNQDLSLKLLLYVVYGYAKQSRGQSDTITSFQFLYIALYGSKEDLPLMMMQIHIK